MKIEFHKDSVTEEILCPDGTFLVGCRCSSKGKNFSGIDDMDLVLELFGDASCETLQREYPDGTAVTFYCYVSDDPQVSCMMSSYSGLRILELSVFGILLTVTV